MKIIDRHVSPDGKISLVVGYGDDGTLVVGFEGATWHTHPDCLASWLCVAESESVATFIARLLSDELPIIMSEDGGITIDPWVSDCLPLTLSMHEPNQCVLRYWSGNAFLEPLKADKNGRPE